MTKVDKYEQSRQYAGNGTIKCGICFEPLVEHGPPPCPHSPDRITVPNRMRNEQKRRRKMAG